MTILASVEASEEDLFLTGRFWSWEALAARLASGGLGKGNTDRQARHILAQVADNRSPWPEEYLGVVETGYHGRLAIARRADRIVFDLDSVLASFPPGDRLALRQMLRLEAVAPLFLPGRRTV